MSAETMYLVWCAALAFVQVAIAASLATMQLGLPALAGNREHFPELTGLAGRATRAHRNMLESLVLFAILVLAAQAANVHNGMTLLGAQLFFWARLVYAVVYIAGLPWIRTAIWAASVVGMVLIFLQLV
jgi:uncharacterized MAPEG superfamily protein